VSLPWLGTRVATYPIVLAAYFLAAIVLVDLTAPHRGLERRRALGAFAFGVPAGIVGSRLLDMLEYRAHYHTLSDALGRNGSSIYGGLLLSFAVTILYARSTRIAPLKFLDSGAPAMALGEAMSRIGCFLNGCCYGVPWDGPWAVRFPPGSFAFLDQQARGLLPQDATMSLAVHPVQLYSSLIMLVVTGALYELSKRPVRDGVPFSAFLVCYGSLRLAMTPMRMEALGSMVALSIAFIAVGLAWMLAFGPSHHRWRHLE
jgi:phosphatidylglycerol---prolipoprotein diacylglyceryl transferase